MLFLDYLFRQINILIISIQNLSLKLYNIWSKINITLIMFFIYLFRTKYKIVIILIQNVSLELYNILFKINKTQMSLMNLSF